MFVGITIFGTLLSSLPRKINKSELGKKSYIIWALAGAIAVGLSDSLSKNIIDKSSAASFLFALAITQIPISLLYLKIEKQSLRQFLALKKIFGKYRFSMAGSIFNVIGLIFLWLAFEYSYASIASPLTAAYPGLMVILAMLWLKEKPRKMELVGLGFIIVGIIGISSFY